MKNIFIALALLSLFVAGCKKENNEVDDNVCLANTFQVIIDEEDLTPIDIAEDNESNTIILCRQNSKTKIIKLNSEGNVLWSKFIESSNYPLEVLVLNDNSMVVLLKGKIQTEYFGKSLVNVWIEVGINLSQGCIPMYELGSDTSWLINGEQEIIKLNDNGEQEWSRTIQYCNASNHSMINYSDNSFLLLASDVYGRQPEYVYDANGVFQDTVRFPLDSNKLVIHNISYNNDIIWKTEIDNITNDSYSEEFWPPVNLIKLNNKILVKSLRYLITLNNNGIEEKRTKLYPEHCGNRLFQMTGLDDDSYIVTGGYSIYDELEIPVHYTKCFDANDNLKWQKDFALWIKDANSYCFITHADRELIYYDVNGEIKWKNENIKLVDVIINCNNGITYVSWNNDKLVITRTDNKGNI